MPSVKAGEALAAGIQCVLKTQIAQRGKKTVWCAQYDAMSLRPSRARAMEPATLSGLESLHLLQFLMRIRTPSPQIVAAIESGLAWFEKVKITGFTKTKREGNPAFEPNPASTEVY